MGGSGGEVQAQIGEETGRLPGQVGERLAGDALAQHSLGDPLGDPLRGGPKTKTGGKNPDKHPKEGSSLGPNKVETEEDRPPEDPKEPAPESPPTDHVDSPTPLKPDAPPPPKGGGETPPDPEKPERGEDGKTKVREEKSESTGVSHPLVLDVRHPQPSSPTVSKEVEAHVLKTTGLTIQQHLDEVKKGLEGLAKKQTEVQRSLGEQTDKSVTESTGRLEGRRMSFTASVDTHSGGLSSLFEKSKLNVESGNKESHTQLEAQKKATFGILATTTKTEKQRIGKHLETLDSEVKTQQAQFAGSFEELVQARATLIRETIDQKADDYLEVAKKTKEDFSEVSATGAAALNVVQQVAQSRESYKVIERYTKAIKEYGAMAAKRLASAKDASPLVSGALHAPTLEEFKPASKNYDKALEQKEQEEKEEIDKAHALYGKKIEQESEADTEALDQDQQQSQEVLDQTKQGIDEQLQTQKTTISDQTEDQVNQVTQTYKTASDQLQSVVSDPTKVPTGPTGQTFASSQSKRLQSEKSQLLQGIEQDTTKATEQIEQQASEKQELLDQKVQEKKQLVVDQNKSFTSELSTSTTAANEHLADVGSEASETTHQQSKAITGRTTKITGDTKEQADKHLTEQIGTSLDTYEKQSNDGVMNLAMEMQQAVDIARKTAGPAELQKIKDRSDKVWEAIDGPGTYEDMLLQGLRGMTPVHGEALTAKYSFDWKSDIVKDIKGDTSGDLLQSCLSYLKGDNVAGAKHALAYSSNTFWSVDTEVAEETLRELDDEEREELLADPDFPEIKDRIRGRLAPAKNEDGTPIEVPYDLDVFDALTQKGAKKEDILLQADAVRIMEAMEGPGTEEKDVYEILESRDKEGNAKLKEAYAKYANSNPLLPKESLEEAIEGDFSGTELKRAKAGLEGDKGAARAYQLHYSGEGMNDNDEAMEAMENKDYLSKDWLAGVEAQEEQESFEKTFQSNYGSMDDYIDQEFDGGEGEDDNRLDEILKQKRKTGGEAEAKDMLAYSTIEAGTREDEVDEALQQLADISDPMLRQMKFEEMKVFFKEQYGIDNLEKYLGVGKYRDLHLDPDKNTFVGPDGKEVQVEGGYDPELTGQDAFNAGRLWEEIQVYDADSISGLMKLATMDYEFYRSYGGGSGFTDLLYSTGEKMDAHWKDIQNLYNDKSWQDGDHPKMIGEGEQAKPDPKWKEFQDHCDSLNRAGDIFRNQRKSLTDAITNAITVVGAIVITALSFGSAAPVAVALVGSVIVGSVNMIVKTAMLGEAYGAQEAAVDLANIVADAVLTMATAGIGKFKGLEAVIDGMVEEKGLMMEIIGMAAKKLPDATKEALSNEEVWRGENLQERLFSTIAWSVLEGTAADLAGDQVKEGMGGQMNTKSQYLLEALAENTTEVLANPESYQGEEGIGWELLKENLEGLAKAYVKGTVRVNALKALNGKDVLSGGDWENLEEVNEEDRGWMLKNLDARHFDQAPPSTLNKLRDEHPNIPALENAAYQNKLREMSGGGSSKPDDEEEDGSGLVTE